MSKKYFKTDLQLRNLKPPHKGQTDYWDEDSPLGVRISHNGTATFFVMARILEGGQRKLKRINFAHAGAMSLTNARQRARDLKAMAKDGYDPRDTIQSEKNAQIEDSKLTFEDMRAKFLERYCRRELRNRSYIEYKRILESDDFKPWLKKSIKHIGRKEIVELLDSLHDRDASVMANRYRSVLSKFMNWCADKGYIESAPPVPKPGKEKARDRVLSESEILAIWTAANENNELFNIIVKLLLLTGQRRSEVLHMRWDELHDLTGNAPHWIIPASRSKNGIAHTVPLSPQAVSLIQQIESIGGSKLCFTTTGNTPVSGISKMKSSLDKTVNVKRQEDGQPKMPEWKLHDLRRTAASGMAAQNVPPHVIDKILNHSSGEISGVAAVYNRHAYDEEKRVALNHWGAYIERLTSEAGADNVRYLHTGSRY